MLDLAKRFLIVFVLALFICFLFVGANTSVAAESHDDKNDVVNQFIWPTVGEISDTYGTRNGRHFGIDIAAPEGTPVVSIADGIVSRSYFSDSYGHVIFIKHHERPLESVYAHLHTRNVEEGMLVREQELIGTVGNTGHSNGNHLHFEVHKGEWNPEKSASIDPLLVLSAEPEAMYAAAQYLDKAAIEAMTPYTEKTEAMNEEQATRNE